MTDNTKVMGEQKNNQLFGVPYTFSNSKYSPDDTAKGLLLFVIFQSIISLVYQALYYLGIDSGNMMSFVFTFLLDGCFVLAVFLISKSSNYNMFDEIKIKSKPTLLQIALCVALSLVCIFGFSGITNIFLQLLYNIGYVSTGEDIIVSNFGLYIFYTIVICVLPALCEEILFRGLIFNGLKRISTTVGIFGSAFLFMLMHGSPDQTVHQFILGIILASAYLITSNIWVPILIHFFNNFIAVTYSFITYSNSNNVIENTDAVEMYFSQYIIYAIIAGVIACCLVFAIFKVMSNNKKAAIENEKTRKQTTGTLNSEFECMQNFSENANEQYIDGDRSDVDMRIYRTAVNPESTKMKLTTSGKFIYFICIAWMAFDWLVALAYGLADKGI